MPGLEAYLTGSTTFASLATIIARSRKQLEDEPFESVTTSSTNNSTTTVAVSDGTQWALGDTLEFSDGEQCRVISVAANNLTVKRAHNDTTAASHASGDVILKNPVYPYDIISSAVTDAIKTLTPEVWVVQEQLIAPDPSGTDLYPTQFTFLGLVSASQQYSSSPTRVRFYGVKGGLPISVVRNLPSLIATYSTAFQFPSGFYHSTFNVSVYYRSPLTTTTVPDNDMARLVVFKACAELVAAKEVPAATRDKGPGETITGPGQRVRTAAWFEGKAEELKRRIKAELWRQMPPAREWIR